MKNACRILAAAVLVGSVMTGAAATAAPEGKKFNYEGEVPPVESYISVKEAKEYGEVGTAPYKDWKILKALDPKGKAADKTQADQLIGKCETGTKQYLCGFRGTVADSRFVPKAQMLGAAMENCSGRVSTEVVKYETKFERQQQSTLGSTVEGSAEFKAGSFSPSVKFAVTREQSQGIAWGVTSSSEFRTDIPSGRTGYVEWKPNFTLVKGWIFVAAISKDRPADVKIPVLVKLANSNRDLATLTLRTEKAKC